MDDLFALFFMACLPIRLLLALSAYLLSTICHRTPCRLIMILFVLLIAGAFLRQYWWHKRGMFGQRAWWNSWRIAHTILFVSCGVFLMWKSTFWWIFFLIDLVVGVVLVVHHYHVE